METDETKRRLRRERWQELRGLRAARFPGAVGRIPNFTGAEMAAERLARDERWTQARVLKCNPDLAQRPVRYRALREGKTVVMAVPRLATEQPFVELDPDVLGEKALWHASSIGGGIELGKPVQPGAARRTGAGMRRIDLVVIGAVAVARDGARLGKGGGYCDLEYALLREAKLVGPRTPVVTTVHASQVLRRGTIPMEAHDVPVDFFVTAERKVRCDRRFKRPSRILARRLDAARRDAIPVLAARAR